MLIIRTYRWGLAAVMVAAILGGLMVWTLGNLQFWYDEPAFPLHVTRSMIVALTLIFSALAIRFVAIYRARSREKDDNKKRNGGNNQKAAEAAPEIGALVKEARAAHQTYKRENKAREHVDTVTIVGVAIACSIAYLQWETFEKTDQTLQAQQRAWINPNHPILDKIKIGDLLKYNVVYGNAGKEPAINIVIQQTEEAIDFFPDAGSWESVFAKNKVRKFDCSTSRPNAGGFAVFPTTRPDRFFEVDTRKPIPSEKEVFTGTKILLVKGCFGYETLKTPRYSWYCYFWPNINEVNQFRICPAGTNGAD